MTPSIGANTHAGVDEQGGTAYHDSYTARGDFSFSPWADPTNSKSVGQINLSYVSLVKADTVYLGSIVNTSRGQFHYHYTYFSGTVSYLVNQYHLTVNQSSAVTSVSHNSFIFTGDQASMSGISNLNSPLKTTANSPLNSTLLGATGITFNTPIIKIIL